MRRTDGPAGLRIDRGYDSACGGEFLNSLLVAKVGPAAHFPPAVDDAAKQFGSFFRVVTG